MKTALSRLRKERGLTQRELAELLHISQTSVSKYERGAAEPDLEMVLAMADFFGVSTDEFLRTGRRG
jgi:transcriptional regulator with XRE-family HTH domain